MAIKKKTAKRAAAKTKTFHALVTTAHRGVFFGTLVEGTEHDDILTLRGARNCLYWSAAVKGFLGLAVTGPDAGSRVGPPADISLRNITCVVRCTPEAAAAWERAPWK
jgi:hypothetical protein